MKMTSIITIAASLLLAACAGPIDYDKYPIKDVFPDESGSGSGSGSEEVAAPHKVECRKNASSAWNTYTAYTVDRIPGFTPTADPEVDEYGGWKIQAESAPDGFFRVKKIFELAQCFVEKDLPRDWVHFCDFRFRYRPVRCRFLCLCDILPFQRR